MARTSATSLCERIFKNIDSVFQFEHLLKQHLTHVDFRVRLALLRHPYCVHKHLSMFLEDLSWQVLSELVRRKDLPEELFRYIHTYKKGIHYLLDFELDQHPLKKVVAIDSKKQDHK